MPPGFRADDLFVIRIQDTCNDQFVVSTSQKAREDMKILFRQDGAQAEDIWAGGAVAGMVKGGKFIDIASIVNDFHGAVPQPKVSGHGGECKPGNTDNMVSAVNAGLHLADSFFYFAGICLPF